MKYEKKRSEINKIKRQHNWRQGRSESHCDICMSMSSYRYHAGFGTRLQKVCDRLKINTEGIKTCNLFTKNKGVNCA